MLKSPNLENQTEELEKQFFFSPKTAEEKKATERKIGSWEQYYIQKDERFEAQGGYPYYHNRRLEENAPYYRELVDNLTMTSKAAELGIGAGTGVIELTRLGYDCTGIDNEFLFPLVIKHIDAMGLFPPSFINGSILNIPVPDQTYELTFSHGTLEHFGDDDIIAAIKEALRVSKRFIFVIPTELDTPENKRRLNLSAKHFGDERLIPLKRWEEMIEKAGGRIERKFGYWIPELGSTKIHPKNPEEYYGRGIFAGYNIVPQSLQKEEITQVT